MDQFIVLKCSILPPHISVSNFNLSLKRSLMAVLLWHFVLKKMSFFQIRKQERSYKEQSRGHIVVDKSLKTRRDGIGEVYCSRV